jgi:nicotinamidase-related amidase
VHLLREPLNARPQHPRKAAITRFITPQSPVDMPGMWQRYYSRWRETTRDRINPALLELLPPLAKLSPPAAVIDKTRFSGFAEPQLLSHLQARNADGLVITGSETDVCVLVAFA